MNEAKVYLAGPLFTTGEREFNVKLARMLEKGGLKVWLPQEHEPRELTARAIYNEDVAGLDWCDTVIACMDGPDPDSGTCWEVGYAVGWNRATAGEKKLILLYRTDFRVSTDGGLAPYNLMLTESCDARFDLPFKSTELVASTILEYMEKR